MTDFGNFNYVPILRVSPAEMQALEEMQPPDQDAMLPYIVMRPWVSARQLDSALARVAAARGGLRPLILDITSEPFEEPRRPVHDAIDRLRNSDNGYRNYCDFIAENENFIPSLQLATPGQIREQAARLVALDRGCVIRLTEPTFRFSRQIAELFMDVEDPSQIHFILDYARQSRDLLTRAAGAIGILQDIRRVLPDCFMSVSASTFPDSFVGITRQEIFERQFHDEVFRQIRNANIIYSDRASVRAESQIGGGNPAPRVDNALRTNWQFFRVADNNDRDAAFQEAAENAMESNDWTDLGIWGTDEIIRTADGQRSIASPTRSTAVRINIHMHCQTNFDGPPDAGAEVIWSD